MKSSAYPLRSLLVSAAGLLFLSCTPPAEPPVPPPTPGTGGAPGTGGGRPGTAGSGGSAQPTAGSGGAPTAGSSGTGGGGSGGTMPPPMGGTGGSADGPTPPASPDGPPAAPRCDYTLKANAGSRKLQFERINLVGLPPPEGMSEMAGYRGGLTELKFVPGTTNEFFLTRKAGQVFHYRLEANNATLLATLNLGGEVTTRQDCGLISMDFDPDFAGNKFVYFGHCTGPMARASKISRFSYAITGQLTSRVDVFNVTAPAMGNAWHSVGSMGFDKDKNLWMVHGEFNTGMPAQDLTSPLGKLHRIVPNRETTGMGGSTSASGNPDGLSFIARGLRSPWRGAYHPAKNWYFIADVAPGQMDWEEINIVTQPGANLGWPGATCNAGSLACWAGGLQTMKVTDMANLPENNATRPGRSAWVAPPYGDCGNDRYESSLTGVVLVGDFFKGWVIGMILDDSGAKIRDVNLADPPFTMISSVTQGPDGYFYVTKFGNYHQGAVDDTIQGVYRVTLAP